MFILTAVGPDRPGMAHAVAQELFESGCNIEDTTMTRLSGQFAQILVVEAPPEVSFEALESRLAPLEASHGLTLELSRVEAASAGEKEPPRHILTAYGAEKTGLLAHLTGALASHEVNITDVQTRVASRGAVYVMILELELPSAMAPEKLQEQLVAELPELQITLRPLEEETL